MPRFTAASISGFDGMNAKNANAIYIALRGLVYDVSAGREFWGSGGIYHSLAGRDVTVALAKRMLSADQLSRSIVLDNELSIEEQAALDTHERQFQDKYPVVGRFEVDATASADQSASRTFQLAELHRHDAVGHASAPESCPLLLAVRGKVFDVSRGAEFRNAGPFASLPGHDCTLAFAKQSTDPSLLDSSFENLSFDELARLEAWTRQLEHIFPSVGFIVDWEPVERMRESMKPRPFGTNLHTLIDQGDMDGIRAALCSSPALINQECARSGLTPLHKAAEAGDISLVRLLVSMGADLHARAPLYDNETPIEIARRFKHSLELITLLE
jgi:membrane-associated progesterone receptor component